MAFPKQGWHWAAAQGGRSGVHTYEGQLVWWHTPPGPYGRFGEVATTQTFADFLAHGPKVDDVPANELEELRRLLGG